MGFNSISVRHVLISDNMTQFTSTCLIHVSGVGAFEYNMNRSADLSFKDVYPKTTRTDVHNNCQWSTNGCTMK